MFHCSSAKTKQKITVSQCWEHTRINKTSSISDIFANDKVIMTTPVLYLSWLMQPLRAE